MPFGILALRSPLGSGSRGRRPVTRQAANDLDQLDGRNADSIDAEARGSDTPSTSTATDAAATAGNLDG